MNSADTYNTRDIGEEQSSPAWPDGPLAQLQVEVEHLEKVIDLLRNRISEILSPVEPSLTQAADPRDVVPRSRFGNVVGDLARVREQLEALIRRIEL